jgi:hypothetical protein
VKRVLFNSIVLTPHQLAELVRMFGSRQCSVQNSPGLGPGGVL